jgi:hypothetical protein
VYLSDDAANPDTEILNAVRPTLATTGGPLICISSPYARKGEMWQTYSTHFGPRGDKLILVAQGESRKFNASLSESVVNRAYERDPARASAEYGAIFRSDLEAFVNIEVLNACVARGVHERQPDRQHRYIGFVDPSGGSADSFTLAIAHLEGKPGAFTAILDVVRERTPPFSPEQVTEEFSELLKRYRITKVYGDRYAGEWPREQFTQRGVSYGVAEQTRSELYLSLLPLINSRAIDLLDHTKLLAQIGGLERRTSRTGKDAVDHRPGSHDDLSNAAAGALTACWAAKSAATGAGLVSRSELPQVVMGHEAAHRLAGSGRRHTSTPASPRSQYNPFGYGRAPWDR